MARISLKKNKRTKHGRTRRQRQRRRQMRGGDFLDYFKPTVKDAAYCQKQFDECNANIKPQSDSAESSSDFFKTPNIKVAARFSHDIDPQYLSQLIGNETPFGVHAWSKYDRHFWTSHPHWPVLEETI